MPKKSIDRLVSIVICSVILLVTGCQEQKKETPQTDTGETQLQKDSVVSQDQAKPDSGLAKEQALIPDITGTWTGKLEHHTSVLKITEQDSLSFKGNISTSFRNPINQQVSGKFDPVNKTLTMKDLIRNRYQGTYSAKLSEDLKSFSGTFKPDADNEKWTFNYKKK